MIRLKILLQMERIDIKAHLAVSAPNAVLEVRRK
jgi:hypothetical protein